MVFAALGDSPNAGHSLDKLETQFSVDWSLVGPYCNSTWGLL